MKKTFRTIGVLFIAVVCLWLYNSVNEIRTVSQPQPAVKTVTNPEPTVSAPADGSVIVRDKGASFEFAPISKQ